MNVSPYIVVVLKNRIEKYLFKHFLDFQQGLLISTGNALEDQSRLNELPFIF